MVLTIFLFESLNMSAIVFERILTQVNLSAFAVIAILQVDSVCTLHSRLLCLHHMTQVKGYI